MKQTKFQKFKQAIKNPPPERLAAIEYRSHFLQMIGITAVCIMLIVKGLWYIIFAFIFGVGISYSQGMSAYIKYKNIIALVNPEKIEDFEKDISPTRRRNKIIKSVLGLGAGWVSIIFAVALTILIIPPTISRWLLMMAYPLTITLLYVFFYFFIAYWIAYPVYKKRINKCYNNVITQKNDKKNNK